MSTPSFFVIDAKQSPEERKQNRLSQLEAYGVQAAKQELQRSLTVFQSDTASSHVPIWSSVQEQELGLEFIYECIQKSNRSLSSREVLSFMEELKNQCLQLWIPTQKEKNKERFDALRHWLVTGKFAWHEAGYFQVVYANAYATELLKTEFSFNKLNELLAQPGKERVKIWNIRCQNPMLMLPDGNKDIEQDQLRALQVQKDMAYLRVHPDNVFLMLHQLYLFQGAHRIVTPNLSRYAEELSEAIFKTDIPLNYNPELARYKVIADLLQAIIPDLSEHAGSFKFFAPALGQMAKSKELAHVALPLYAYFLPESSEQLKTLMRQFQTDEKALLAIFEGQASHIKKHLMQTYDALRIDATQAQTFAPVQHSAQNSATGMASKSKKI